MSFAGVRLVDSVGIFATAPLKALERLLNLGQCGNFLGQQCLLILQRQQLTGIRREVSFQLSKPSLDFGDIVRPKSVNQHELRRG